MTRPVEHLAVVIPARDEERLLPRCLTAVETAIDRMRHEHPSVSVRLVVVVDRSTDGTLAVVHADPRVDAVVVVDHGNVGAARHAGIAEALGRSDHSTGATWVATTDADSIVPPGWLVQHVMLADDGADAVIGTVTPEFEGLSDELVAGWLATHKPGEANGHVHGANLGVRGSTYEQVGGFASREVGEDVELIARIAQGGWTVTSSGAMDVSTSSRIVARAPHGYAAWLHGGGLLRVAT